jgi:site-specific DNA-cytosine methylase
VGRVANGVPDRAHRLKALGNAIVPQIAELLGHAILQSERRAS